MLSYRRPLARVGPCLTAARGVCDTCPDFGRERPARRAKERGTMATPAAPESGLPMRGVAQPSRDSVLSLPGVHISRHPVIIHKLTALRDKHTPPPEFYRLVRELGTLLAYEATADIPLVRAPIDTPLEPMEGLRLAGGVGIVPILRA